MKRKIKILYVAAEVSPYANAGGLGEVGRSFPKALIESGNVEVRRVMPLYKTVDKAMKYLSDFPVVMDQGYETCVLKTDTENKEIITYFIENDRYFCRDNIYGYEDDGYRFFFFCRAVVEMLKKISYKPDIVHTNDWHTGFLPLLLKKEFPNIKSVYTIHNISYQGFIPSPYLAGILTEAEQKLLGWPDWLNFMKAGILYSDLLTTVSPGYGEEIKQPTFSCGMSSLMEQRDNLVVGIVNGVDTESYDPKQDKVLEYPYDSSSFELKKKNRSLLRLEYGLQDTNKPLIAMITRIDYSKGIDILLKTISYSDFNKFQLIIHGSGNAYYQGLLASIAAGYSDSIIIDFNYSEEQARKIYAAADIYLMPSLFEPCGLGQLYAMRYGAVPIVNPVGGLKDTIIDDIKHPTKSTGFYMKEWSGEALNNAIKRALKIYDTPEWNSYIKNGMNYDSSWKRSVVKYLECYEALLANQS
ncbi:MAG: glycogen synthase [Mobilitalea sp.]